MAQVFPFAALRFSDKAGDIAKLTCPPYDIISEEQRKAYLAENPHNIIRLELPRGGEDPYAAAGETLKSWLKDGILKKDDAEAFYIYAIDFTVDGAQRSITGLVGRVRLTPFSAGVVLPHEETLSKAKADRLQLMRATGCNFSNIYSLYREDNAASPLHDVTALTAKAALLHDMTDENGLRHRLWAITDKAETAAITAAFADKKLYIADGHHRYETALNYLRELQEAGKPTENADCCMMMLVEMSHKGLWVFPTHRVLHDIADFSGEKLLSACAEYFRIEAMPADALSEGLRAAYAAHKTAFGFFDGRESCLLTLKDETVMDALLPALSPASRHLDVTVLHTLILERLLGIDKQNMANGTNLTYTRDAAEAVHAVRTEKADACFLLNPTRVEEIRDVAAAGEKMPQKSTYFYPKLITGLTVNPLF